MKKVIVTGAGGFIGGALTELLLNKDIIVYGVDTKILFPSLLIFQNMINCMK